MIINTAIASQSTLTTYMMQNNYCMEYTIICLARSLMIQGPLYFLLSFCAMLTVLSSMFSRLIASVCFAMIVSCFDGYL